MRIKANTEACIGAGQCVLTDPTVFDQDDDGIVVLLTDQPTSEDTARDAVSVCPAQALSIEE
ncbi:ferredoxin [Actinokineospora pegani]|uniref:ferredoxin n=1 Tax=Actinokineospora pegani TaxID=2654637 RepID=UPI0012EAD8E3|nr:ferredoxin [Actinokineospora pegani]